MSRHRLEFYSGTAGWAVGYFRTRGYPTGPGRYRYSPYRGVGHAWLTRTLRKGLAAECWFLRRGERIPLVVIQEHFHLGRPGKESDWFVEVSQVGGVGKMARGNKA